MPTNPLVLVWVNDTVVNGDYNCYLKLFNLFLDLDDTFKPATPYVLSSAFGLIVGNGYTPPLYLWLHFTTITIGKWLLFRGGCKRI